MTNNIFDIFPILKTIPTERFPKHVFFIPDGNGRWAKQHHRPVSLGHKKGAQVIDTILRDISQIQEIKIVTIWGFSADNWKRSQKEITTLLRLMQYQIESKLKELHERNSRFIHLGRKDRLPNSLLKTIEHAEQQTKNNSGQILSLAIDFGGEDQELRLLQQAKKLSERTTIDEQLLWQLRDGHGLIPSADLLIRTSGEKRTSDVGWLNGISTELYFIEKYLPDITTADIIDALIDFSKRERRFGARK